MTVTTASGPGQSGQRLAQQRLQARQPARQVAGHRGPHRRHRRRQPAHRSRPCLAACVSSARSRRSAGGAAASSPRCWASRSCKASSAAPSASRSATRHTADRRASRPACRRPSAPRGLPTSRSGSFPGGAPVQAAGPAVRRGLRHTVTVYLHAPISLSLLAVAIALAVAGGLIAGAFGGWRASRLQPGRRPAAGRLRPSAGHPSIRRRTNALRAHGVSKRYAQSKQEGRRAARRRPGDRPRASSWPSRAPPARARPRCCRCWARWTGHVGLGALRRARPGQHEEGELTKLRSRAFGFIFQAFNLIPTLTAQENVETALVPLARPSASAPRGRGRRWRRSASPTAASTCRRSCRAASSSASPSLGRWCARRA